MTSRELAPKKSLGQHFLHDQNVIHRIAEGIAERVEHPDRDVLLEIGPGTGALTRVLLERGFRVHAFEIDQRMVTHLQETLQNEYPRLTIQQGDFMRLTEAEIKATFSETESAASERSASHPSESEPSKSRRSEPLESSLPVKVHLVGNLPYYATSPILFKTLEMRDWLTSATFMIQKEVADRIVAGPGTKEYGILSVQTQLMSRPEILFDVKPGSFTPPPKVMSSVIQLAFNQPALRCKDATLKTIVRTAFQQRRKKLSNALKSLVIADEYPEFDFSLRAEVWEPRMYERMAEAYEQNVNSSSK